MKWKFNLNHIVERTVQMPRYSKHSLILTVLLVVAFSAGVLFISVLGAGSPKPEGQPAGVSQETTGTPQVTSQGKDLLNQFSAAFESVAAKVNPSVVPIFSEQVMKTQDPMSQFFGDDFFRRFFGNQGSPGQQKQTVRSLGSGVIVSKDGYILTNNHVVDGSDKLTVQLQDKKKYTAKVVGRDPQTDIAVIKINADNLPVASLGNSDNVKVGQWVLAIGNPFNLMHTVTAGIISAKGRSSMNLADYEDFIQTDASINPGNSGGALADLDGNVIGINTAIYSPNGAGNVGIGFSVPINMAKNVMNSLIANGKVSRGYLGLVPQDIDDNLAKALNLKTTDGSLVGDVSSGGPADKAGIKRGDIITAFNGTKVTSSTQLRNLVAAAKVGSSAKVELLRDGKDKEVAVTLAERPKDLNASNNENDEGGSDEEQSSQKLGLSVQSLTAELARQLKYEGDRGVLVSSVTPGSAAEDAGIRRGDLIKEVNRKEVASVQEFNKAVKSIGKGDTAAFLVRRGPNTFYVGLQLPS
jgi:serine protease Do